MNSKGYVCICHVCRQLFTIRADFLSTAFSIQHTDGRTYPATSCGGHTAEQVKAAYDRLYGLREIAEPEQIAA